MKEGLIASAAHMEEFRRTHHFNRWFEASAKDNTNIVETFSFLVDQVRQETFLFFLFKILFYYYR